MKNNSYTVAVLGAGNIGSAVISRLLHLDNEVININLSKVLVSDSAKDRDFDSNLTTEDFNEDGSKNLFSSEKDEKIKGLMRSIDNTNYRYGRSTLSLASAGVQKRWNMRREHSSKIDTADFYLLPTISTN